MGERRFSEEDLLAAAGALTDPEGRILGFEGQNRLAWLTSYTPAQVERAERSLRSMGRVPRELRATWFVREGSGDDLAFGGLYEARAEKALQVWRDGSGFWSKHNRATLHRLLAAHSFSPEAREHLCDAAELYLECALEMPEVRYYRRTAIELVERLASEWLDDLRTPGPYSRRELMLIEALLPERDVDLLQSERFAEEVQRLQTVSARLQQELLPYLGTLNAPPEIYLDEVLENAQSLLFEPAETYRKGLLPESSEYRALGRLAGEAAAVLSWTYRKLEREKEAERWWAQALRWSPSLEERLESGAVPRPGEERTASVYLGEQSGVQQVELPSRRGPRLLGIGVLRRQPQEGSEKETWLEAFMLCGVPVFPLRRLKLRYHAETGETGQAQDLPLHFGHHLLQAVTSMLVALALLSAAAWGWHRWAPESKGDAGPTVRLEVDEVQGRIQVALERLKGLAVEEARLQQQPPTPERDQALRALLQERAALIEKIERWESALRKR